MEDDQMRESGDVLFSQHTTMTSYSDNHDHMHHVCYQYQIVRNLISHVKLHAGQSITMGETTA